MTADDRRPTVRSAAMHVLVIFVVGMVLLVVGVNATGGVRTAFLIAAPVAVGLGAGVAMTRTWLVWRAGGFWQAWQGASWFLLLLMLVWVSSAVPALLM